MHIIVNSIFNVTQFERYLFYWRFIGFKHQNSFSISILSANYSLTVLCNMYVGTARVTLFVTTLKINITSLLFSIKKSNKVNGHDSSTTRDKEWIIDNPNDRQKETNRTLKQLLISCRTRITTLYWALNDGIWRHITKLCVS